MNKVFVFLGIILFLNSASFARYKVIIDTDIDSDVGDVEALAMVHTLADEKKIDFLGVIVTSDDALCNKVI